MYSVACKTGVAFTKNEIKAFKSSKPQLGEFSRHQFNSGFAQVDVLIKHACVESDILCTRDLNGGTLFTIGFPYLDENNGDFFKSVDGFFIGFQITQDLIRAIRDPAGSRALYYTQSKDNWYIASEINSFKNFEGVQISPRKEALAEYLSFSFIPGPSTFVDSIYEISLGSYLEIRESSTKVTDYCRYHEFEKKWAESSLKEIETKFHLSLKRSAKICRQTFQKDPVFFLSGGLDSSSVLGLASTNLLKDRPRTISVHFGEELPNENSFIDLMVDKYQTRHDYVEISPKDFINDLPKIFEYIDDPIGDPVVMPNYLLNKIISSENNFIFTGEGGDPCLGGPKNNAMLMASFYGPGFGDNEDNYLEISYLNSFKRCYDDLSSALPESFRADQTRMIEFLRPYLRDQNLESFTNRLLLSNIKLKATSLIMPKVHKTTLAFGNLSVSPLYTRKIIESSMSVPAKYKMHRGDEKYILKQVMGRTVPDEILARPKSGMRVPLRIWSSNEMVNFNREYIHSHKALINEWFDYNYINKLIDPTMRDAPIKRAGLKLWMITTFLMYLTNIKQTNNH